MQISSLIPKPLSLLHFMHLSLKKAKNHLKKIFWIRRHPWQKQQLLNVPCMHTFFLAKLLQAYSAKIFIELEPKTLTRASFIWSIQCARNCVFELFKEINCALWLLLHKKVVLLLCTTSESHHTEIVNTFWFTIKYAIEQFYFILYFLKLIILIYKILYYNIYNFYNIK